MARRVERQGKDTTDHQMFKLVDTNTVPSEGDGCSCGCGGKGRKARAGQVPEQALAKHTGYGCSDYEVTKQVPAEHAGYGCGGHDALAEAVEASAEQGGRGCGGHDTPAEHSHEMAAEPAEPTTGGCNYGDGAPSTGDIHAGGAGAIHRPGADELIIHSIPHVMRHAVLFTTADNLPVGENIQTCAPHQPESLLTHLQDSEQYYRVETPEVDPMDRRYHITCLT